MIHHLDKETTSAEAETETIRDGTWASQSTSQENTEEEGAQAEGQSGNDREDAEAMDMDSGEEVIDTWASRSTSQENIEKKGARAEGQSDREGHVDQLIGSGGDSKAVDTDVGTEFASILDEVSGHGISSGDKLSTKPTVQRTQVNRVARKQ